MPKPISRAMVMVVACLLLASCASRFTVAMDPDNLSEDQAAICQNIFDRASLLNKGRLRDTLPYFADTATVTATSTADRKHTFTKDEYEQFVVTFKEHRYRELRLKVTECQVTEVLVEGDSAHASYTMQVSHRYGAQTLNHQETFHRVDGRWLVVENSF